MARSSSSQSLSPSGSAVAVGARSYRHVDSILKHGLDRLPEPMAPPQLTLMPAHAQIRGREYYQDPPAAAAPAASEDAP